MGFGGSSQSSSLLNYQMMLNSNAGQSQQGEYTAEANRIREQAAITADEYEQAAIQKDREVGQYASEQANRYLSGGVLLQGTPLAVTEETRRLGAQEVDALRRSGAAKARLLRLQADQYEKTGLESLLTSQSQNLVSKAEFEQEKRAEKQRKMRSLLGFGINIGKALLG